LYTLFTSSAARISTTEGPPGLGTKELLGFSDEQAVSKSGRLKAMHNKKADFFIIPSTPRSYCDERPLPITARGSSSARQKKTQQIYVYVKYYTKYFGELLDSAQVKRVWPSEARMRER
jgi:hypothetical protein